MSTWINFRELRERLDFRDVLASYNVIVKVKGDQAQGFCPLPTHPRHEGKRKSPSFSVNLKRGIWQCFSCRASGNILDLCCRLEALDPNQPTDVRQAALILQEKFPSGETSPPVRRPPLAPRSVSTHSNAPAVSDKVIVNAPLDFELQHLDPEHPYLTSRGFTPETIAHFGLGFCAKGMMKDRIAIPLHDSAGRLIGYAGRLVDDQSIDAENPKYKFPGARERNGINYEFRKSEFLYNGSNIETPVDDLIVVEGFASVWWLWQHGYTDVVALMGNSCAAGQAKLMVDLVAPGGRIWLLPDGDDAAIQCAKSVLEQVSPHRFIRWIQLNEDVQPTDYDAKELEALLQPLGARKSGRSERLSVAPPASKSNEKARYR